VDRQESSLNCARPKWTKNGRGEYSAKYKPRRLRRSLVWEFLYRWVITFIGGPQFLAIQYWLYCLRSTLLISGYKFIASLTTVNLPITSWCGCYGEPDLTVPVLLQLSADRCRQRPHSFANNNIPIVSQHGMHTAWHSDFNNTINNRPTKCVEWSERQLTIPFPFYDIPFAFPRRSHPYISIEPIDPNHKYVV
jgi:hypothetical protein